MSTSLMPNYARLPVCFVRGEGAWLWDTQGKRYLDAMSGVAVCGLGHAHPAITAAICDQAGKLIHTSNWFEIANQQALADALTLVTGMESVFFSNSGAEANEAAIKIARLYGHRRNIDVPTIIVTEGSFHGRTLATLTASGNKRIQMGFEPLVSGFLRVPYNDVAAIEALAAQHPEITAILVEPVAGEGGVIIPDADYLQRLRTLCDQHDWLLMLDEVQTGIGRTGTWLACQQSNVLPDVLTLAKGLGGGIAIGACLARGKVATILQPGTHGSTFGGSPLACRVGLTVLNTIEQDQLLARVQELGQRLQQGFTEALYGVAAVTAIRVKGLMIGIELKHPCQELMKLALLEGVVLNVTAERVVRLLPPFILTNAQADEIIATVSRVIQQFSHSKEGA